jgi:hypothetical protein
MGRRNRNVKVGRVWLEGIYVSVTLRAGASSFFLELPIILANYLKNINTFWSKTHILIIVSFVFAVSLSRPHPSSVKMAKKIPSRGISGSRDRSQHKI